MPSIAVGKVGWEGLGFGGGRGEICNRIDTGGNAYSLSPWFRGSSPGAVPSWRLVKVAAFIEAKQAAHSGASTLSQMF